MEANAVNRPSPAPQPCPDEDEKTAREGSEIASMNNYIQGARLYLTTIALCSTIWLANFEIGIVSTSLVAITNDLREFEKSSWIITSYLLTFTGFFIIWARFSDVIGRKLAIMLSVFIFTVFSGSCGAARTITQLSILRAFQGIGASGCYTMTVVIIFELVPPVKYPVYMTLVSMVFAFSLLIGPLVGGAVTNSVTWRWIFLINVPAGALIGALLFGSIPAHFPHHGQLNSQANQLPEIIPQAKNRRIDIAGVLSLLAASIVFVSALQLAETQFKWSSPLIITFLIISILLWIFFFVWEWSLRSEEQMECAVFPHTYFHNRVWLMTLFTSFLVGIPFTVAVVQIPLRLQVVYGISPLAAAIRFLPFAFSSPFGSALGTMIASKKQIPPIYLLLLGALFQVIGFTCLSILPKEGGIWSAQYGFEIIAALGTGANTGVLFLLTPVVTEKRHHSVSIGAIVQFRFLGGVVGLAIVTSVLNAHIRSRLSGIISVEQMKAILENVQIIQKFEPDLQRRTRVIFGEAYNQQMLVVVGFSVVQFLAILGLWKRTQLRIH